MSIYNTPLLIYGRNIEIQQFITYLLSDQRMQGSNLVSPANTDEQASMKSISFIESELQVSESNYGGR